MAATRYLKPQTQYLQSAFERFAEKFAQKDDSAFTVACRVLLDAWQASFVSDLTVLVYKNAKHDETVTYQLWRYLDDLQAAKNRGQVLSNEALGLADFYGWLEANSYIITVRRLLPEKE